MDNTNLLEQLNTPKQSIDKAIRMITAQNKSSISEEQKELFVDLYDSGAQFIVNKLGNNKVKPDKFIALLNVLIPEYIVYRYNRLGEEGIQTLSVDGYSATWVTDWWKQYEDDFDATKEVKPGWSLAGYIPDNGDKSGLWGVALIPHWTTGRGWWFNYLVNDSLLGTFYHTGWNDVGNNGLNYSGWILRQENEQKGVDPEVPIRPQPRGEQDG